MKTQIPKPGKTAVTAAMAVSNRLDRAWRKLARGISSSLPKLKKDMALVIESDDERQYYVQFYAKGRGCYRIEAKSNNFNPAWDALRRRALYRLRSLGWHAPTFRGRYRSITWEEGSFNYYRDTDTSTPVAELGQLAADTLRHVYGIWHPALLRYDAYAAWGCKSKVKSLALPELGVRHRRRRRISSRSQQIRAEYHTRVYAFVDAIQLDLSWDRKERCLMPNIVVGYPCNVPLRNVNIVDAQDRARLEQNLLHVFGARVRVRESMRLTELMDAVTAQCPDWLDRANAHVADVKARGTAPRRRRR